MHARRLLLTKTSTLLLAQLEDPGNQMAWGEFDGRYRPVLCAFARRLGLQDHDADEAAQAALTRFLEAYREGRYDRRRGRLRSWLFAIARHCIEDVRRNLQRGAGWRGESVIGHLPDPEGMSQLWEAEWRTAVTRAAFAELRRSSNLESRTLRAFEMLALEGRAAAAVADELGMSTNSVYVAKHRAIQQLRPILAQLENEF